MPRPDFFKDINEKHRSVECRSARHRGCPLEVVVGDPLAYPAKVKPCTCVCHDGSIPNGREFLAQQKRIYVVTSEAQCPIVVGLPRVVRANLFNCGVSEQEAWDMSSESAEDERIVKVDWFRSATQQNRDIAQDILTSKLSATIVGPVVAVEQKASSAVAG